MGFFKKDEDKVNEKLLTALGLAFKGAGQHIAFFYKQGEFDLKEINSSMIGFNVILDHVVQELEKAGFSLDRDSLMESITGGMLKKFPDFTKPNGGLNDEDYEIPEHVRKAAAEAGIDINDTIEKAEIIEFPGNSTKH